MSARSIFDSVPGEAFAAPLGTRLTRRKAPAGFEDFPCQRFEFNSRGDRVPGRLILPAESGEPRPLILLQPGAGADKDAAVLEMAVPWVRGGAAVATIDIPLHGERTSAKFSERLLKTLADIYQSRTAEINPNDLALVEEFIHQATCDLTRGLDALDQHPDIDTAKCAYVGFSLGGALGAIFAARDPRPGAVALAISGGGCGPAHLDPAQHVAGIAPRPLLLVRATRDEVVAREFSQALFDAAGEPKELAEFDATHKTLPGEALELIWHFCAKAIGLAGC